MTVCVVGLGYIGLPTALMMAAHGVHVCAVDYNEELVAQLKSGCVTFDESGLPELFQSAVEQGIQFDTQYPKANIYIVAVPTPYHMDTKQVDTSFVVQAVRSVLAVCGDGAVITVESTISLGTIDRDIRPLVEQNGKKVHLAHTPERIIPGSMMKELVTNSRTIGCDEPATGELLRSIYRSFCQGEIVLTDIRTAEMSKVVENTFRDINIAFANELTKICRQSGLDVQEVIRIANKHPRVNILQPGPGVGGHCIPVDPWFLVGDYPELALLTRQAREINSNMPAFVLERMQTVMRENHLKDLTRVGLYGLAYKEDVDDVRESPTMQLLDVIKGQGLPVPAVFDPMVKRHVAERQYEDFDAFLNDVDMVVVLVGHSHLKENAGRVGQKAVLDTRNVLPEGYRL